MSTDVDTPELTIIDLADAIADLECKIDEMLSIMQGVGEALSAASSHPMLGQFFGKMP